MSKKIIILFFIIIMFVNIKSYAFTFNPAHYIITQSSIGMALSIKEDEESNFEDIEEKTEEVQEGKEESLIDKIINWIKNLFKE